MKRLLTTAAVLAALWAAPAHALPELRISMPGTPYAGQYAPVYVDAFQEPGRLLYRFDALIHNEGTTLDLYREPDGSVRQALWPAGQPVAAQEPGQRPPGSVPTAPAGAGARMEFVEEETHAHFHFFTAARYELLAPAAAPRVSGKIGYCMFDSFDLEGGVAELFRPDRPWCHEAGAEPGFVRMGLSPGAADRYSSQREFQYVDVTGLTPGTYTLRGIANPDGHVLEDDGEPDVTEVQRVVPGVIAEGASAETAAGSPVSVAVSARAVAPEIPARRSRICAPHASLDSCYLRVTATTPLTYAVATPPAHGTAAFDGARLTYTPAPGFTGTDSLTYVATDGRGLTSAPASVRVQVFGSTIVVDPPTFQPRRLLLIGRVRREAPKRLAVRLTCRREASAACSGVLEARIAGSRAGRARFAGLPTGRRRTVVVRLRRSAVRRRVELRATVRDALGQGVVARRVMRPR